MKLQFQLEEEFTQVLPGLWECYATLCQSWRDPSRRWASTSNGLRRAGAQMRRQTAAAQSPQIIHRMLFMLLYSCSSQSQGSGPACPVLNLMQREEIRGFRRVRRAAKLLVWIRYGLAGRWGLERDWRPRRW